MAFLTFPRSQLKEQIFPSSLETEAQKEKRQNGRELCPSSFIEKLGEALQTKSAESLRKARNSKASHECIRDDFVFLVMFLHSKIQ